MADRIAAIEPDIEAMAYIGINYATLLMERPEMINAGPRQAYLRTYFVDLQKKYVLSTQAVGMIQRIQKRENEIGIVT